MCILKKGRVQKIVKIHEPKLWLAIQCGQGFNGRMIKPVVFLLMCALSCVAQVLLAANSLEGKDEAPVRGLATGMLPPEDGFTEWIEGEVGIHFRIEQNRVFVYLLDEDGLIHAPNLHAASILLVGQMNEGSTAREFLPLAPDDSRPAYTAGRLVRPPHIFTATLYLFEANTPEASRIVSFRFNAVADPEQPGTGL
jgi:hypothetical protein